MSYTLKRKRVKQVSATTHINVKLEVRKKENIKCEPEKTLTVKLFGSATIFKMLLVVDQN